MIELLPLRLQSYKKYHWHQNFCKGKNYLCGIIKMIFFLTILNFAKTMSLYALL